MPSKNPLCLLFLNYGSETVFSAMTLNRKFYRVKPTRGTRRGQLYETMRSADDHPLHCDPFARAEIAARDFAIRNV